jgi:hypothetical protein
VTDSTGSRSRMRSLCRVGFGAIREHAPLF